MKTNLSFPFLQVWKVRLPKNIFVFSCFLLLFHFVSAQPNLPLEFPGLLEVEQRGNNKTLYYFDVNEGLTVQDVTSGENSFLAQALSITNSNKFDNELSIFINQKSWNYREGVKVHNYTTSSYWEQKYKGILVVGGSLRINFVDNKVAMIASDIVPNLNIDTNPTISTEVALQIAQDAIEAERYAWEVEGADSEAKRWRRYARPVIVPVGRRNFVDIHQPVRYKLSYACYIHSAIPYDERLVYVDAKNGKILGNSSTLLNSCPVDFNQHINSGLYNAPPCMKKRSQATSGSTPDITLDNSLCHQETILPSCTGNTQTIRVPTLYYGCRDIQVESCFDAGTNGFVHVLRNTDSGFPPIQVQLGHNPPIGITDWMNAPYVGFKPDDANLSYVFNFSDSEEIDMKHDLTGVSAYWAGANAFNLFKNKYLINSYDNAGSPLRIKVNASPSAARWGYGAVENNYLLVGYNYSSGNVNGLSNPSVSLDVMAHEYSHGVMFNHFNITAITSSVETGALHEGLADVFGVLAEDYAFNQGLIPSSEVDWSFAEDSQELPSRFADCAESSLGYTQTDTYESAIWNECDSPMNINCSAGDEPYIKAGVIAYWFYLMAEGGQGTNEINNNYNVTGIGMNNAGNTIVDALSLLKAENYTAPTFEDFKAATMRAVKAAHGSCNPFVRTVAHAWYAVGMGDTDLDDNADSDCYCKVLGGPLSNSYISKVKIGTWENTSGDDGGYADYSFLINLSLKRGACFNPNLISSPAPTILNTVYWKIWMDDNQDGSFDSDELVYSFGQTPNSSSTGTTLPTDMYLGLTRMRVAMSYGTPISDDGCADFNTGEIEDYMVEILDGGSCGSSSKEGGIYQGEKITLYPIPSRDTLSILYDSEESVENVALKIMGINGSVLHEFQTSMQKGQNKFDVNIQNFTSGTYFVSITDSKKNYLKKFVVLK